MKNNAIQPIHLLYVPTLKCNLGCRYCYLGSETDDQAARLKDSTKILSTLDTAVKKLQHNGYFPFNISLHGGEVTTLPKHLLEGLFDYIGRYYQDHKKVLTSLGFKKSVPHIKTNLFNYHTLVNLFEKYRVSISASVDVPLFLHAKYRTTRQGGPTLDRILNNIKLLSDYPYGKKISTTLFKVHYQHKKILAGDIWKLHREYGFDMNRFNLMFGFESAKNRLKFKGQKILQALSGREQLDLYFYLKEIFSNTELQLGLETAWFEEFTPSYCTNCFNCGEKFFLLQSDGSIYSCVRGQGVEEFYYGNILTMTVQQVMEQAKKKISYLHKIYGFHDDCAQCDYLHLCHTGCPFVKYQQQSAKSYTCRLQKALYKDRASLYQGAESEQQRNQVVLEYVSSMHPNRVLDLHKTLSQDSAVRLPNDLYDHKNSLNEIIHQDTILQTLYSEESFFLGIDDEIIPLYSQILKPFRELHHLYSHQQLFIHIRKEVFSVNCRELVRNTLYLQMLRDTPVVYGDEKRTKQEHTFTYEVFYNALTKTSILGTNYVSLPITDLLVYNRHMFRADVLNNLFVTTRYLREYHYHKQRENGFYHIQALNLPFQNLEFFWE
jgi:uncharacterized protein